MSYEYIGFSAALLSAASWALGSILFKQISETVSPFGVTLAKGFIGIILLGTVYLFEGIFSVSLNAVIVLTISGIIGIAIGDTLFFASLKNLGPKTQVIFFMFGNIMTAVFGMIFLKEFPSSMQWIGIMITLIGVASVLWSKIFSYSTNVSTGVKGAVFGVLAMVCFSSSLVIAKDVLDEISTIGATFYRITSGTIGMAMYGFLTNDVKDWIKPFRNNGKMVLFFIGSVSVVMFGGFWLSLVAIKYVNIGVASALNATEPLFVLPLAYFILKEKISRIEIFGAVITVLGVVLLTINPM